MTVSEKEQRFFEELQRETRIEILVREGALSLIGIHEEIERRRLADEVPATEDESLSRHFKRNCGKVKNLVAKIRELTEEAVVIGPDDLPKLLFVKFGPAFEWVTKALRRYFAEDEDGILATFEFRDAFRAFKDEFRAESQSDDNPDRETFASTLRTALKTLEQKGLAVARRIEIIEDRKAREKDADYCRRMTGKGCSSFGQIGRIYKGVGVVDPTHVSLYGEVVEITSRVCWNILDGWLDAHFSDALFPVNRRQLEKFSSAAGQRLRRYVYLQTRKEVGQPRRGNATYTGFGEFRPLTAEGIHE